MSLTDRLLGALGADPAQFRALFAAHLKLDFRRPSPAGSAMRQRELSVAARLGISFLLYMVFSSGVAMTAFAAADARTYAAVVLGYVGAMLGMLILMEFGVVAVQGEDLSVLAHRPVSDATYTWAKVANLAAYVGLYALAVIPLPVAAALALPSGGAAFAAWLLAASVLGTAALGGLVLAAYGALLRRANLERARDLLNWLAIAFSVAVPVAYMLASHAMERRGLSVALDLSARPWLAWLPPVWLAGAVDFARGLRDPLTVRLAGLSAGALLAGAAGWAVAARGGVLRLGGTARPSPGAPAAAGARPDRLAWLRPLFATAPEWGGFRLLLAYLARDRGTKARLYPQFGMSLAFFLVTALQGRGGDPWAGGQAGSMALVAAFYPAVTCAWLPLLLRFSEQWEAAWVFAVAPGATLADMARALQRAVVFTLLLPSFLLTWAFFALLWGHPGHALLHVLPPCLGAVVLMDLALLWRRPVPLSSRYVKGEAGTRMAITFTLMAAFAALGLLQGVLAGSLAGTGLLVAAELAAAAALGRLRDGTLARRAVALADL